ncbi:MAG: DUF4276 family protein [Phycisphaerales bacterium]
MMREVLVLCEGVTEREFCRSVIGPYLSAKGILLSGTLQGTPQRKRGGVRSWPSYRNEILRLASEHAARHVAVLVDYYGLPSTWPGRAGATSQRPENRGALVEDALWKDLELEIGTRFHPCVQLHEYESLLFVDPELSALSLAIGGGSMSYDVLASNLSRIKSRCGGLVEGINDSPENAPSKRLLKLIPGYDKVAWGVTAAADVEVPALREGCPWLNRWLSRLEAAA